MKCPICGGKEFTEGFLGRKTNGVNPMCTECKTVERHRIAFGIYSAVSPLFKNWRVLQFAPDRSINPDWFAKYVGSSYGNANSYDMMDTGLPDGSFDMVTSNHVLEHVSDDMKAIREMLRLVGKSGIVSMTVPTPVMRWQTRDWGFADPAVNEHYRDYGADFPQQVVYAIDGVKAVAAAGIDKLTGTHDIVYFFSQSDDRLEEMAQLWRRVPVPLVRLFSH